MTNMDFTHQLAGNETLRKKKTARKCFLVDNDFLELDFRWNKITSKKGCRWCCQRSILSFHFVQPFSLKTPPRFIFDLNKSLNLVTVLMAQENAWMIFSNVFSVEWWMKGLCFELWEKENRIQLKILLLKQTQTRQCVKWSRCPSAE